MKKLGRLVPVHYQEPFRRGYGRWEPATADFLTDLRGSLAGGAAGWCFHNGGQHTSPDNQPRRSFDMRQQRLFDQLDEEEREVVEAVAPALPAGRPRYLMGVGTAENLIEAVSRGVDMFDCVLPTRNARNGALFTRNGLMVIKNACYGEDDRPIEEGCLCYTCSQFSRAYLRHLFMAKELLVYRLNTILEPLAKSKKAVPPNQGVDVSDLAGVPPDAARSYQEAVKRAQAGKLEGSVGLFEKAIEKHPGFYEAINNLGVVYLKLNRLPEAEKTLKKAAELQPEDFRPVLNLGIVHFRSERFDVAATELARALQMKPGLIDAERYLGALGH